MSKIERLLEIMAKLRDPESGCPWDREQSFSTIAPYTIEEAYEVADAIEASDMEALRDELGDLLFQVVFHARLASEAGHFDFDDVVETISEKMLRRHPHVFGDAKIASSAAQTKAWEKHKAAERQARATKPGRKRRGEGRSHGLLDGIPQAFPALTRALKLQERAGEAGFDWPSPEPVFAKLEEEIAELRQTLTQDDGLERSAEEMGDLLFACANLARHMKVDPETALRAGNAKFERRFRRIEALLAARGRTPEDSDLDEMEKLWERAKTEEKR